ncbi:MAG: hypothetical protein ACFFCL_07725 [Promethearchaeota archaeon]
MIVNKTTIVILILVIFGFSLIITIPIFIISYNLSNYGIIDENLTFMYVPSSPSTVNELNINIDIGNVEIRYIYPPFDYYAKVEVDIEMMGKGIVEKSYLDFFDVSWENESSFVNFNLLLKSDINPIEILPLIKNITIIIELNAEIIYDLRIDIDQGNFEISVPWGATISNLLVNITYGNILYYLNQCTIEGNITGSTQKGILELKTSDAQYNRNSIWTLSTHDGNMDIEIKQYKDMGANITGKASSSNSGIFRLIYEDNKTSIGAMFILQPPPDWVSPVDYPGFYTDFFTERVVLTSYDFPAENFYNLSLSIIGSGYFDIDIKSD